MTLFYWDSFFGGTVASFGSGSFFGVVSVLLASSFT